MPFIKAPACAVALLLAITPLSAEISREESGPPGVFAVGGWTGQCFRDGFLAGREVEDCGAILKGPIKVWLFRTVDNLKITVSAEDCSKKPVKAVMDKAALARATRTDSLAALISKSVAKVQSRCGKALTAPAVTTADLTDILTETDGLEF